jgi:hypothetical protein
MEPGGSLPCSQVPNMGTYPEPDQSNPRLRSGLFTSGFLTKTLCEFLFPNACYMPFPSNSPKTKKLNSMV